MEKVRVFVLFILFLLSDVSHQTSPVYAEGIDIGAFRLYPTIKIEERFEDNFYLLPNAESAYISAITPEIFLEGKCSGDNALNLDYKYQILFFDDIDIKEKYTNEFNMNLKLAGNDHFLQIDEKFKEITEPGTYTTRFVDYDFNDIKAALNGDYNKFSFTISAQDLNYSYQAIDSANNRNEDILSLIGYYKFLPKTKALLEYKYGDIDYQNDKTKDAYYNEFLSGASGELTQKMTGTIKFGYQDRNYKQKQDWKKAVTYTDIIYTISPKTTMGINFTRSAQESAYTAENYYETNKAAFTLTQKLSPKTSLSVKPGYIYDRYPTDTTVTTKRKDNLWSFLLALDIKTRRWLVLGGSYEHKERNSNNDTYDYKANITSIYLKAMY